MTEAATLLRMAMEWIFLEMLVALLLAVVIVGWTMWPRHRVDQARRDRKEEGARSGADRE